jgi:hypothetical protein
MDTSLLCTNGAFVVCSAIGFIAGSIWSLVDTRFDGFLVYRVPAFRGLLSAPRWDSSSITSLDLGAEGRLAEITANIWQTKYIPIYVVSRPSLQGYLVRPYV